MKKSAVLPVLLAILTIGLSVLSYCILPDTVVVQLSVGSSGNSTAPKWLAVLIPFALGIGGAAATLLAKEGNDAKRKGLVISAVGIALFFVMIAVNALGQ